jgi:hypothetical protein
MSGEGAPQPPSRGRRVLAKLDYALSILITGKPPIPADEQRRNREAFMRMTREFTEIAVLVTLLWVVAMTAAYLDLPVALPPLVGWGALFVGMFWFLKIAQIVMNRRRLRPWRGGGGR